MKLGVSTATVSLCLNRRETDHRYCIRPDKAERIRAYAKECGYIPYAAAVNLRSSQKFPPVGILFNESHGFERRLQPLHDAISTLEENGRDYLVISYHITKIHKALELLRSQRVTDVLVLGYIEEPCPVRQKSHIASLNPKEKQVWEESLEDWRKIEKLLQNMTAYAPYYKFPRPVGGGIQHGLVRMGNNIQHFEETILRKILAAGLGPVVLSKWSEEKDFVPELLPSKDYIITRGTEQNPCDAGRNIGFKLAEFRKKHFFRTVFYGNDIIASGIITGLIEAGLRVPEDVGILGFGNDDMCSCMRVPLSSFDNGIANNTAKAVKAIVKRKVLPDEIHTEFQYYERESFRFP